MQTIVAGTGHRPNRLQDRLDIVRANTRGYLQNLAPDSVISGMADGFDMILAEEALAQGIPLIAAVPWVGHGGNWSRSLQGRYMTILERAAKVHVVSQTSTFHLGVYCERNEWMAQACNRVVTCWDGVPDGGTYDMIVRAERLSRPTDYLLWRPK